MLVTLCLYCQPYCYCCVHALSAVTDMGLRKSKLQADGHRAKAVSCRKLKRQKDSCSCLQGEKVSRALKNGGNKTNLRHCTLYSLWTRCRSRYFLQEKRSRRETRCRRVPCSFARSCLPVPQPRTRASYFHLGRQADCRAQRHQRRRHRRRRCRCTEIPSRNWNIRTWPLRARNAISKGVNW